MRTLALELAPHSIRVNTVHPTSVNTDMIQNEATYRLFLPGVENPTPEQFTEASQATDALPIRGSSRRTSPTRCCSSPRTRPGTSPASPSRSMPGSR